MSFEDYLKQKNIGSGFQDDPAFKEKIICIDRSHEPPSHLHIPVGKIYVHKCPSCGVEQILRPLNIFMSCQVK